MNNNIGVIQEQGFVAEEFNNGFVPIKEEKSDNNPFNTKKEKEDK